MASRKGLLHLDACVEMLFSRSCWSTCFTPFTLQLQDLRRKVFSEGSSIAPTIRGRPLREAASPIECHRRPRANGARGPMRETT